MIIALWVMAVCSLIFLVWKFIRPGWMGFEGKTLWDWINVISVPMIVGLATLVINNAQKELEQRSMIETAVQNYIDRVSTLVLSSEQKPDLTKAVINAQTQAILNLVEGERAGRVLAFLSEMDLLKGTVSEYEGMNLAGSNLKRLDLSDMDFEDSDLSHAELEGTDFSRTDFEGVAFNGADIDGAILIGADLRGATGLTKGQLEGACYDETTLLPANIAPVTGISRGCREDADHDEDAE
ncbi:pentapeptide repeat-containing protein [Aliiroseovarius sp. M344]|uniref:pentapeptide repeat-containing protein n=1 Tax=Aliiroseovarius sp. M344 TaxID=2867010 RepID=UPI0021AD630C|nr:pentapeptide repeat-containing protein [Aliiroseovarius sp. M344]UWQ13265.1 pentapeptide repeat-containing protein [Aliiroseovarius sp. M344]